MEGKMKPKISVRKSKKEGAWEVVADFGKYGRLFHCKAEAEQYAKDLQNPGWFLQGELNHPTGLKRI